MVTAEAHDVEATSIREVEVADQEIEVLAGKCCKRFVQRGGGADAET